MSQSFKAVRRDKINFLLVKKPLWKHFEKNKQYKFMHGYNIMPMCLYMAVQVVMYCEIAKWSHLLCRHLEVKSQVHDWALQSKFQHDSMIFLVKVQLRSEVLHTQSSTQPGFEPITFRSWECSSCLLWPSWRHFSQMVFQTNGNAVRNPQTAPKLKSL